MFDQELKSRSGPAMKLAGHENQSGGLANRGGRVRLGEFLPGSVESVMAAVIQPRQFLEVGRTRPARVLQALRELAPCDVALDLHYNHPTLSIEANDVRSAPFGENRLSRHRKERLSGELVGIGPQQVLDLRLIELCSPAERPKSDQVRGAFDLEERHFADHIV